MNSVLILLRTTCDVCICAGVVLYETHEAFRETVHHTFALIREVLRG